MADCYTHLGSLAHHDRDFEAVKKWYKKALAIYEQRGVVNWAAKVRNAIAQLNSL